MVAFGASRRGKGGVLVIPECAPGRGGLHRSVEVQFFGEHGDNARDLLLLAEARVLRPGLKVGGHHVVDAREDLHDLQLFAELVQDVAECLHEPRAPARIPPGIVT